MDADEGQREQPRGQRSQGRAHQVQRVHPADPPGRVPALSHPPREHQGKHHAHEDRGHAHVHAADDHLERHETGKGGEIQITDAIAKLIGDHTVVGFRFEGERFDCGSKAGFIEATLAFAARQPELKDAMKRVYARIFGDDSTSRTGTG